MRLRIQFVSDTLFGRGDGIAGVVDQEVEHDAQTGLPYIRGRVLRGLIVEECSNLLFALEQSELDQETYQKLVDAARFLFGQGGSGLEHQGNLMISDATVPDDLQKALRQIVQNTRHPITDQDILQAFTRIRRQTAVDANGVARDESLRAMRVINRGNTFHADIQLLDDIDDPSALPLFNACIRMVRRGGIARNHGLGRLQVDLLDNENNINPHLDTFAQLIGA